MSVLRNHEDPVVTAIREALGAVAVGEPATYWLYAEGAGEWCVRREGSSDPERFANRDEALAFARLAVARCSSYSLYIQGTDGRLTRRWYLGSGANPFVENLSAGAAQAWLQSNRAVPGPL